MGKSSRGGPIPHAADVGHKYMKIKTAIAAILFSTTLILWASTPPKLLRIGIATQEGASVYTINDEEVTLPRLTYILDEYAKKYKSYTLMIHVDGSTTGNMLLSIVNECKSRGISSLRIFVVDKGMTTEMTLGDTKMGTPVDVINSECEGKL